MRAEFWTEEQLKSFYSLIIVSTAIRNFVVGKKLYDGNINASKGG